MASDYVLIVFSYRNLKFRVLNVPSDVQFSTLSVMLKRAHNGSEVKAHIAGMYSTRTGSTQDDVPLDELSFQRAMSNCTGNKMILNVAQPVFRETDSGTFATVKDLFEDMLTKESPNYNRNAEGARPKVYDKRKHRTTEPRFGPVLTPPQAAAGPSQTAGVPSWMNQILNELPSMVRVSVQNALLQAGPWTHDPSVTEPKVKVVHPGITCSECSQCVAGVRYKCGNCADFDLCEACESAMDPVEHSRGGPEHVFIKIRQPLSEETNSLYKTLGEPLMLCSPHHDVTVQRRCLSQVLGAMAAEDHRRPPPKLPGNPSYDSNDNRVPQSGRTNDRCDSGAPLIDFTSGPLGPGQPAPFEHPLTSPNPQVHPGQPSRNGGANDGILEPVRLPESSRSSSRSSNGDFEVVEHMAQNGAEISPNKLSVSKGLRRFPSVASVIGFGISQDLACPSDRTNERSESSFCLPKQSFSGTATPSNTPFGASPPQAPAALPRPADLQAVSQHLMDVLTTDRQAEQNRLEEQNRRAEQNRVDPGSSTSPVIIKVTSADPLWTNEIDPHTVDKVTRSNENTPSPTSGNISADSPQEQGIILNWSDFECDSDSSLDLEETEEGFCQVPECFLLPSNNWKFMKVNANRSNTKGKQQREVSPPKNSNTPENGQCKVSNKLQRLPPKTEVEMTELNKKVENTEDDTVPEPNAVFFDLGPEEMTEELNGNACGEQCPCNEDNEEFWDCSDFTDKEGAKSKVGNPKEPVCSNKERRAVGGATEAPVPSPRVEAQNRVQGKRSQEGHSNAQSSSKIPDRMQPQNFRYGHGLLESAEAASAAAEAASKAYLTMDRLASVAAGMSRPGLHPGLNSPPVQRTDAGRGLYPTLSQHESSSGGSRHGQYNSSGSMESTHGSANSTPATSTQTSANSTPVSANSTPMSGTSTPMSANSTPMSANSTGTPSLGGSSTGATCGSPSDPDYNWRHHAAEWGEKVADQAVQAWSVLSKPWRKPDHYQATPNQFQGWVSEPIPMKPVFDPANYTYRRAQPSDMDKLVELGFCNRQLNSELLSKYCGNLELVIGHLVSQRDDAWHEHRH